MIEPIPFPEMNADLQPLPGVPDCYSLPVYRNEEVVISKWRLTKKDIDLLSKNGGTFYLIVMGSVMPAVSLVVDRPFPPTEDQAGTSQP